MNSNDIHNKKYLTKSINKMRNTLEMIDFNYYLNCLNKNNDDSYVTSVRRSYIKNGSFKQNFNIISSRKYNPKENNCIKINDYLSKSKVGDWTCYKNSFPLRSNKRILKNWPKILNKLVDISSKKEKLNQSSAKFIQNNHFPFMEKCFKNKSIQSNEKNTNSPSKFKYKSYRKSLLIHKMIHSDKNSNFTLKILKNDLFQKNVSADSYSTVLSNQLFKRKISINIPSPSMFKMNHKIMNHFGYKRPKTSK